MQEKKKNNNNKDILNKRERIIVNDLKAGNGATGVKALDIDEVNRTTTQLSQWFLSNQYTVIGSVVPLFSYHGIITSLSCFLHTGLTFHHFTDLPRSQPEDVDVMVCYEEQLPHVLRLDYKLVIVITEDPQKSFDNDHNVVVSWDQIPINNNNSNNDDQTSDFQYTYSPTEDQGFPFRQTTISNSQTFSYTHQNFVSSCATIVKSLPLSHELTPADTILITQTNDLNQFGKFMAVLLMGGDVVLGCVPHASVHETIDVYKPTIVTLDSSHVQQFLNKYEEQQQQQQRSIWSDFKQARAQHLLSEGIFTESCTVSHVYRQLRLSFIANDATNNGGELSLSSGQLTTYRILTGSRAVTERSHCGILGPVLSTNFYDYRIFSNKQLCNCGVPSLALEMKLRSVAGYGDVCVDKAGEVCVRGFIVGTPYGVEALQRAKAAAEQVGGEGWCPLVGFRGRFGVDGCFYES